MPERIDAGLQHYNNYAKVCAIDYAMDGNVKRALEFLGNLRPAFVAHLAERLGEATSASNPTPVYFTARKAPVRTHSVLLFLLEHGPSSLMEMARSDGQSHQLLASRLKPLEKLGLIERLVDPTDARRYPYKLSRAGKVEATAVLADMVAHARAMEELFAEMGVNLVDVLDNALEALRVRPLQDRIGERSEKNSIIHAEFVDV
jgi:DNA-binding MarR family transcriptional regulator